MGMDRQGHGHGCVSGEAMRLGAWTPSNRVTRLEAQKAQSSRLKAEGERGNQWKRQAGAAQGKAGPGRVSVSASLAMSGRAVGSWVVGSGDWFVVWAMPQCGGHVLRCPPNTVAAWQLLLLICPSVPTGRRQADNPQHGAHQSSIIHLHASFLPPFLTDGRWQSGHGTWQIEEGATA